MVPYAIDPVKYREKYRIEALRAASRIVAGICVSGSPVFEDKKLLADEVTILIAEQFAKYLETGER